MVDAEKIVASLRELDLPAGHWAVHASAVMALHGLLEGAGDVDVVARGPAWQRALQLGTPKPGKADLCVALPDLGVEVWSGWMGEDVDALIDGAVEVAGVPCVDLRAVLRFKETAGRPKDAAHLAVLRRHLEAEGRSRSSERSAGRRQRPKRR